MSVSTQRSDAVFDAVGNVALPIQRAKVDSAASFDVVAASSGNRIRVVGLSLYMVGAGATLKFQSGGSMDLTGAMTSTTFNWALNAYGWLQTNVGEKLNAVLAGATQLSGVLEYVLVPPAPTS